ncbi:unnamed protein product [Spirodela intermedia]|uniref:DC1 domain-containing protein n=1 Tax=Spirodela intermedia TaxID=51605 RepID=A0A7I8IDI6_SPIIN|nr:unnamed protein product [Spirodela intermedia]CAA6655826.1 unnamed protein product [Spirodela intermedia]
MGRLEHEPVIQHVSHTHPLELSCVQRSGGWNYACKGCGFFLHISCAKMPRLIDHPSHPSHALVLLPAPAYPEGSFNCDACGRSGKGFSYHCAHCHVDLHALCAAMPLFVAHQAHHHTLTLGFSPPYECRGFSCDICGHIGSDHWLYRCALCEFDAHLSCATANAAPPQRPAAAGGYRPPQQRPQQVAAVGMAAPPPRVNPAAAGPPPMGNNIVTANDLVGAAVQGFVEGEAVQVGQTFAQSVLGVGDGGGSAADGEEWMQTAQMVAIN